MTAAVLDEVLAQPNPRGQAPADDGKPALATAGADSRPPSMEEVMRCSRVRAWVSPLLIESLGKL